LRQPFKQDGQREFYIDCTNPQTTLSAHSTLKALT